MAESHSEVKVLLHLIVEADPVMRIAHMGELGEALVRLGADASVTEVSVYVVEDWALEALPQLLPPLEESDVSGFQGDDASG